MQTWKAQVNDSKNAGHMAFLNVLLYKTSFEYMRMPQIDCKQLGNPHEYYKSNWKGKVAKPKKNYKITDTTKSSHFFFLFVFSLNHFMFRQLNSDVSE